MAPNNKNIFIIETLITRYTCLVKKGSKRCIYGIVSSRPSQNQKKKTSKIEKGKMVRNCLKMMDGSRYRGKASYLCISSVFSHFSSIFLLPTFLLPTTCFLLGIDFLSLHMHFFSLRYHPMISKTKLTNQIKN